MRNICFVILIIKKYKKFVKDYTQQKVPFCISEKIK